MIKNRKKKGFTIVELVIVIAVIGILAAILIPTFINLTARANRVSNESFVKNINTQLAMDDAQNKKHETIDSALAAAKKIGFHVDDITPYEGNDIVWDEKNDRFAIVKGDFAEPGNQNADHVVFADSTFDPAIPLHKLWKFYDSMPTTQTYSIAAKKAWNVDEISELKVGFNPCGTMAVDVAYVGTESSAYEVDIATNGGELNVGSLGAIAKGTINVHGSVPASVAYSENNSLHVYGEISDLDLQAGRAVAENKGKITLNKAAAGTKAEQAEGGILYIPEGTEIGADGIDWVSEEDAPKLAALGYETEIVDVKPVVKPTEATKAKNVYEIASKEELLSFRDKWNSGSYTSTMPIKVTADIDISKEAWKPIGNRAHPFYGNFDGLNHKITGLSNKGYYVDDDDIFTTDSTKLEGAAYGFFGVVGFGNNPVNISNLTFADVDINGVANNMCGVVVGADMNAAKVGSKNYAENVSIDNVSVSGTKVKSADTTAGIMGKAYTKGKISITNCTTDILVESEGRSAGIIAYISGPTGANISNNTVKKDVYAKKTAVDKVALFSCIGKNFVFDKNTTTGMKAYYNGEEQEDYYSLVYVYDENGNATSVTITNDASKVKFDTKHCGLLNSAYDGAIIGTAEHPFTFPFDFAGNNQMNLYDGVVVDNLIAANYTGDGTSGKYVYTYGTVTFNGGHIARLYQNDAHGHVIFNGGDFDQIGQKNGATYTVTGGSFYKSPNLVEFIPGRTTETGSSSGPVGTDYYCLRYFLFQEGTTNRYDYIICSVNEGWVDDSKVVGGYTVARTGEPGSYTYVATPLSE